VSTFEKEGQTLRRSGNHAKSQKNRPQLTARSSLSTFLTCAERYFHVIASFTQLEDCCFVFINLESLLSS